MKCREQRVMIHTCLCGTQTVNEDGVCLICKAKGRGKNPLIPTLEKGGEGGFEEKTETNGGEKMGELKGGHRTCSVEGCKKYVVKEGKCTRHYNEAHGIVKKRGNPNLGKAKKTTSAKAERAAPSPHPSPSRGEGKGGGDIIALLTAERDRIDAAIEVIRKYA